MMEPLGRMRTALLGAALAGALCIGAGPASAPANDDPALREYLSANGLLNRGLNELACKEYRKFLTGHADHPRASLARYGLGVALFRLQRLDEAATELKQLSADASFEFAPEVQAILGQCALAQKQYEAAADCFRKVLQRKPAESLSGAASAGLVESLYRAGRYDDAMREARAAPKAGPARQRVDLFIGLAQIAKHDDAAAAATFENVIAQGGDAETTERATLLLAQCCVRLHQPEKAAKHFRSVLEKPESPLAAEAQAGLAAALLDGGKPQDALGLYDNLLTKDTPGRDAWAIRLQRGQALFAIKDYGKALKEFAAVAESTSDSSPSGAYWAAKCLLRLDRPKDAAEKLRAAIRDHAESELLPEMSYDLGVALARADRTDDALAALGEFQKRFPKHALSPAALRLTAELQHQQKHFDRCIAACRAYLDTYADSADRPALEFLLAESLFLAGDMPRAADAFSAFIQAHADDANVSKARFRLGVAQFRQAKLDDAKATLAPLAKAAPDDATVRPALQILAEIAFQRSEWKSSEEFIDQFLAADRSGPTADQALLTLGLSRARQERWKDAIVAYDELLKRFETSPYRLQAEFERGQALLESGDDAGAKASFERVLASESGSPFAAFARNHLATIAARNGDSRRAAELFGEVATDSSDPKVRGDAILRQAQTLAAAGRDADAEAALNKFLKEFAGDARLPIARARLAVAIARQNRCEDGLRRIDAALSDGAAGLGPALVDSLQYEKAWCLRSLVRNDEAAAAYKPLIDRGDGPLALSAMLESAEIDLAAGRPDAALKLLKRLGERIAADPEHVPADIREQAAYRVAVCNFQLKHIADAARGFAEFVTDYPASQLAASATYFAGECAFQAGRHSDAFRFLSSVEKDAPESDVAKPAQLRLGETAAALQRWSESEQAFSSWLERFPKDEAWFQAKFGLGWALENQGQHRRAIAAYRKVVESHQGPTAARAQFQIGECLFAQKKYDDAAGELLKVDILYAYPEWSAAALYEAGRCFEQLGKTAEARQQFKSVHDKYAQTRWAAMADERLSATATARVPGR